ncbi:MULTISPECIES: 2-phospho-L-lactate transferase [Methanobacterium]|jgi:LPPG:FO 2-phospho-L-lactate transferase|uniref:2-phospho-L-lactate transferase n=1 Tax=Methanobacterium formicicum TaxID=2162 RepID=A0A090I3Q2_METFO|nr:MULTISPECIES: 2-phospho-L-lactate transferase [Methanobacterium]AIS32902.1 LPPG:FO 2-phospho-L-lactate transferase CofD [Methanobacterium formicicum]KUK75404.1 MAG: 2-phospho-L-lactate transferase [Methanobacterium sp. 42_16]MBF4475158.1 2-phospho-L-lactate transferase [Methanobacterium formicicum]MDD4811103.1 2-phospho-L-lactate transferase [Methanobacterium formicicum]MDG3546810.1 2-phospho-L-lactate transferase [Methanobacterium formicicum]
MISVLSGGTGTPKLLQGMVKLMNPEDITVIVNTLENDYFSGVYVAPDVDTVLYTLAGIINEDTWYGVKGDSFITHDRLKEIGCPETLRIGDRDRAMKIQKTLLMKEHSLSEAVDIQRKELGIKSPVIPMSNQQSQITITTDQGAMGFHQFLVENQGTPRVLDVSCQKVDPAPGLIESIEDSDMVVIGPSNPITSIGPIISAKRVKKALKKTYVVGVSPIVGDKPVSGPAAKFMQAKGHEVSVRGVASMYHDFMDRIIIDQVDANHQEEIEKLILDVMITETIMTNMEDKINLARCTLGENV